jgi:hypothetical protein
VSNGNDVEDWTRLQALFRKIAGVFSDPASAREAELRGAIERALTRTEMARLDAVERAANKGKPL